MQTAYSFLLQITLQWHSGAAGSRKPSDWEDPYRSGLLDACVRKPGYLFSDKKKKKKKRLVPFVSRKSGLGLFHIAGRTGCSSHGRAKLMGRMLEGHCCPSEHPASYRAGP